MTHILHLDSSARGEASQSRKFSKEFVEKYVAAHPGTGVTYRDIGHDTVPHVTEPYIGATYTPAEALTPEQKELLALSNTMVAELQAADVYVFGVPMYNFSVPSTFKAYIDQVVRPFLTWNPMTYEGLLKGKKLYVITAHGGDGYQEGQARAHMNVENSGIKLAFGLMGITDVEFIPVENTVKGDETTKASAAKAEAKIESLTAA